MAIAFDKSSKLIVVEAPDTDVTIQELIDEIRDWQDELVNMETDNICNASGKEDLAAGVKVGITLELINDWRLAFEDRGGPTWTNCIVAGGNLVATNSFGNDPIYPATYINTVIAQSSSATLLSASGATLGPTDIPMIADAIWDEALSGHTTVGTAGEELAGILDMLENELVINQATSEWWLYNDVGDTVIKIWPLLDKDGGVVVVQGTGPMDRKKRTL